MSDSDKNPQQPLANPFGVSDLPTPVVPDVVVETPATSEEGTARHRRSSWSNQYRQGPSLFALGTPLTDEEQRLHPSVFHG